MSQESEVKKLKLSVTCSPHVYEADSVARIMWEVNLALVPALAVSFWVFGIRALVVIIASILGAVVAEAIIQGIFLRKKISISDGSAVLTGLLLAFCVPAALPAWIAFIGGFVAILFGKQVFGGIGNNIFNPAHVARAILLASWPAYMTTWLKPCVNAASCGSLDGLTAATPLGFYKETMFNSALVEKLTASGTSVLDYVYSELHLSGFDMLLGKMGGSLGETGKIALLIGAAFLFYRKHITWQAPVAMISAVFFGALISSGNLSFAFFHLFSGGLIIGAFFMTTDMVTAPVTSTGRLIFGLCCGAITLLIRLKGGYPEGVCYSILIMNAFVPLIDRFTFPTKFGFLPEKPKAVAEVTK
ncbi:MAG: RnfABCDGE type electron transport complex subunit D [Candidatus Riflebacteria bacterium]|nr:RnfABCDGE type electron transport complex subunit D [Candidatus Riflebacteria bacterium]